MLVRSHAVHPDGNALRSRPRPGTFPAIQRTSNACDDGCSASPSTIVRVRVAMARGAVLSVVTRHPHDPLFYRERLASVDALSHVTVEVQRLA